MERLNQPLHCPPSSRPIEPFWAFLKAEIYRGGWQAVTEDQLKSQIAWCLRDMDWEPVQSRMDRRARLPGACGTWTGSLSKAAWTAGRRTFEKRPTNLLRFFSNSARSILINPLYGKIKNILLTCKKKL